MPKQPSFGLSGAENPSDIREVFNQLVLLFRRAYGSVGASPQYPVAVQSVNAILKDLQDSYPVSDETFKHAIALLVYDGLSALEGSRKCGTNSRMMVRLVTHPSFEMAKTVADLNASSSDGDSPQTTWALKSSQNQLIPEIELLG